MKSTAFTAIVIAFGEVESISAFMFRLRGERLLSLCGESKQRRIKGKRETVRCGFPLPFEIPSPFDRSRFASARQACGVSCLLVRKGSLRDAGQRPVASPRFAPEALMFSIASG